jgi:uncharacterized membrane protein SpoIIM required for sporulation
VQKPLFNEYAILVDFIRVHQAFLWVIGALSLIVFVGTLVAIPMLVIRIPADYFTRRKKLLRGSPQGHAWVRVLGLVLKNLAGIIFILSGIVMLALPGQGVISLLIGLMLVNFPGKLALERRVIEHQWVLRTINWMRLRARKPALKLPRKDFRMGSNEAS